MSDALALVEQAQDRKRDSHFAVSRSSSARTSARVLEVVPSAIPRLAIVALDVLSALAFALVHGTRRYGLRGILALAAICAVVGNLIENLGVATGFPFGRYEFLELMGPRLFHVPVLLGLAYIGMSYVSWMLACVILRPAGEQSNRFWFVPVLAGAIMTAWDLAQDPVWATVLHGWTWRDGGSWFGVPVSNYLGWYATNSCIYLLFAAYLRQRPPVMERLDPGQATGAILFYSFCAIGNILQLFSHAVPATVQDPTGKIWRVADILRASALVSIFVMGSFAALAWVRARPRLATD